MILVRYGTNIVPYETILPQAPFPLGRPNLIDASAINERGSTIRVAIADCAVVMGERTMNPILY